MKETRWRNHATAGVICGVLLLSATVRIHAGTNFSSWMSATGEGQIEYRWKNYTAAYSQDGCSVEFRNLDGNDRKDYRAKVDVVDHKNGDHTERADIHFYNKGDVKTADIEPCDRVTGVLVESR